MTLAAAATTPGIDTTAGVFLIGCLLIALVLIAIQGVISYKASTSDRVDPAQLREAAQQVKEASESLSEAAADNEAVTQALKDAVQPARGAKRRGLETVRLFHDGTPGLAPTDLPVIESLESELIAFDPDDLAARVPAAKAREARQSVKEAREKADEAVEEVEKGGQKSSFFGVIGQITKQHPFIGAALLFVLIGALGADLINFSVS
jgi:hypothetical protein